MRALSFTGALGALVAAAFIVPAAAPAGLSSDPSDVALTATTQSSTLLNAAGSPPTAEIVPAPSPVPDSTAPAPQTRDVKKDPDRVPAAPTRSTTSTASSATVVSWQGFQKPSVDGVVQESSIALAPSPGPNSGAALGAIHRFQLTPQATYTSAGYTAHRVEVFGRQARPLTDDANKWADPPGSVRWFSVSVFIPKGFATTKDTKWLVFTQWKGLNGGAPPITLEIKRDGLRLGGTRTNAGKIPKDGALGKISFGKWTHISVGMLMSTDPKVGWVEVTRGGKVVLPKVHVATMDTLNGKTDPVYLKQGIYRDAGWPVTQTLYLGQVVVSSTQPSKSSGR